MSNSVPETSFGADILRYLRYQLRGRRGLVATGFGGFGCTDVALIASAKGWPRITAADGGPGVVTGYLW